MFFSPNNLYAWEKVPVPDYVDKKTKSPWNFYDDFEDQKLNKYINKRVLFIKILLVSILVLVAFLSLPTLVTKGNTHFKHMLEWNYFVGVILFYLLSRFFWRRTT